MSGHAILVFHWPTFNTQEKKNKWPYSMLLLKYFCFEHEHALPSYTLYLPMTLLHKHGGHTYRIHKCTCTCTCISLCYCINVPETPKCGCSTSIPVHTVEYMWLDARDSNLAKLCNVEVSTTENRHLLIEGCAGKQSIHYVIRLLDSVTSQRCFPVRMLRCTNAFCQIQT